MEVTQEDWNDRQVVLKCSNNISGSCVGELIVASSLVVKIKCSEDLVEEDVKTSAGSFDF